LSILFTSVNSKGFLVDDFRRLQATSGETTAKKTKIPFLALLIAPVPYSTKTVASRLARVEPLCGFARRLSRAGLRSFLQGASLAANSHFPAHKIRRQKLYDLQNVKFLRERKPTKRRNTPVFQVLRQTFTENFLLQA